MVKLDFWMNSLNIQGAAQREIFCRCYITFWSIKHEENIKHKNQVSVDVVISKANKKIDFIPVESNSRKFNLFSFERESEEVHKSVSDGLSSDSADNNCAEVPGTGNEFFLLLLISSFVLQPSERKKRENWISARGARRTRLEIMNEKRSKAERKPKHTTTR